MVKGYMIRTEEMVEAGTEQLFAKFPNGEVKTCSRRYRTAFSLLTNVWTDIEALPADAEFIGNYEWK